MILITKNKEPKEWTKYKSTPGVDYQAIPELVQSLLKEQGYIYVPIVCEGYPRKIKYIKKME